MTFIHDATLSTSVTVSIVGWRWIKVRSTAAHYASLPMVIKLIT